jgi:Holliday junction resolvasome RuvABC endonuclease subunit
MLWVLGIDLGTSCGWALLKGGEREGSGVWDCKPKRHESAGWRPRRFAYYLSLNLQTLKDRNEIDEGTVVVAYEAVERHLGTSAAHVYGELRGVLWRECGEAAIDYAGFGVGTIKKVATGKGVANKAAMCTAARAKWGVDLYAAKGDEKPGSKANEDEADALWIAQTAWEKGYE